MAVLSTEDYYMGMTSAPIALGSDVTQPTRRGSASFDQLNLPTVENPDQVFADITREDYASYINNFRGFENRLLSKTNDTTLIDRGRKTAATQAKTAAEIQARNLERYGGGGLSQAQIQQQQRSAQRGGQLSMANTVNNARIRQRDVNQALLRDLIGIGQGVNSSALGGLATAAQGKASRDAAFKNAKSSYRSGLVNMGTSILAAFAL
tara:strand:- start:12571 stop:13194 length:624 start_codon:yes stop_codon:yes gene_type:complete